MFEFLKQNKENQQQQNQQYLQEIGSIASELEQQAPDDGCKEKLKKIQDLAQKVNSQD